MVISKKKQSKNRITFWQKLKHLLSWLNIVTVVARSVRLLPVHMHEDVHATHQLHCQLEEHSVERIYLRQRCFDASKLRVATATAHGRPWNVPDVTKFRVAVYTISQKAIRFRYPDYDPDRAQKLTSSSMSRHLSTRKMSSKSMNAFLNNLANRQTDRQTWRAIAFTFSVVGGKWWSGHCHAKRCFSSQHLFR